MCYDQRDEDLAQELDQHLGLLQRQKIFDICDSYQIRTRREITLSIGADGSVRQGWFDFTNL
jgi:hypothetical protein